MRGTLQRLDVAGGVRCTPNDEAALGDDEMVTFLNRWLELKRRDRTLERLFDYWYQGKAPEKRVERWSVIRNVLGWVD